MEIRMGYHREYVDDLVNLFNTVFGNMSVESWQWKHLANPLWGQNEPTLVLCFDQGKIVGANGFMPTIFKSPSGDLRAMQSCDTMVHPAYRGRNIFTKMLSQAESSFRDQEFQLLYGFPNENSQQGFVRAGWCIVTTLCEYVRLIDKGRILRQSIRNLWINDFSFSTNESDRELRGTKFIDSDIKFERHNSYPDTFKQINRLLSRDKIELFRNKEYLLWRLDQNPNKQYKYITISNNDELYGYIIVNIRVSKSGIRYGVIVDYRVRDKDEQTFLMIIDYAIKWFHLMECGVVWISGSKLSNIDSALKRSLSFSSTNQFPFSLKKRFTCPLIIKLLNKDAPISSFYLNPASWDITYLYADTA